MKPWLLAVVVLVVAVGLGAALTPTGKALVGPVAEWMEPLTAAIMTGCGLVLLVHAWKSIATRTDAERRARRRVCVIGLGFVITGLAHLLPMGVAAMVVTSAGSALVVAALVGVPRQLLGPG